MSVEFAILGLLSWKQMSGYDVKKVIAESDIFYWSGNNNQVYNSLVALNRAGFVTQEIQYQASLPAKKLYSITDKGRAALRDWLRTAPELPELRNTFLVQLAWADALSGEELDSLLGQYEDETAIQVRMRTERASADQQQAPNRTSRERYLWEQIIQHQAAGFQSELEWIRNLRAGLRERFS
jgi:PadR family transcriptional regulator, regulatory protein AphA